MLVAIIECLPHLSKKAKNRSFFHSNIQRPSGFLFVCFFVALKESAPSCEASSSSLSIFQIFFDFLGQLLDSPPLLPDLLLPKPSAQPNGGLSCQFRSRQGTSWMASQGGQEASLTDYGDGERTSAMSFFSRVAQLRKKLVSSSRTSAAVIQPSKNGFCHTSRTSNGINVGVSAQWRLIAWRASQHANVMHG